MGPETILNIIPTARKAALLLPPVALSRIVSKDGQRIYASDDLLYKGAVFGRDSLEVAEDLMNTKPQLVHNILRSMGELQGTEYNTLREEEPGKIVHEYRSTVLNGKPIKGESMDIFRNLAQKWGGSDTEMAYYGSVDSTPLFLRALGSYCTRYGTNILDEPVRRHDGKEISMREVSREALNWLLGKLAVSQSGLVEYMRVNPLGIENQVWKDSEEFYVHENGLDANHLKPIGSIEVQGLSYDALNAAARLFPEKTEEYRQTAFRLRDRTIELLWQRDREYFALGTDFETTGKLRIIGTKTANPASLLDSEFFDQLSQPKRELYITSIVQTIMSRDFLTNAGIRSRALSAGHLINFWDYHGSFVTWPKETYDISKGLRRQGFSRLADQLDNRLLNIVLRTFDYPEFLYVDVDRVLTGSPSKKTHAGFTEVVGPNAPERIQAWTVSAIWGILKQRNKSKRDYKQELWQTELENYILRRIPHIDRFINPLRLLQFYPGHKYRLAPPHKV
jgi:glycogen debranching enzyme